MSAESKQTITLTPSKVKPSQYAGRTVIFPEIGEATFSDKGTLEVPVDKVESFINYTKDSFDFYQYVEAGQEGTVKKSERQKLSEEEAKIKGELDLLDTKSLIELAKDSGIEPAKLVSMTNGKIKAELVKKFLEVQKKIGDDESEGN